MLRLGSLQRAFKNSQTLTVSDCEKQLNQRLVQEIQVILLTDGNAIWDGYRGMSESIGEDGKRGSEWSVTHGRWGFQTQVRVGQRVLVTLIIEIFLVEKNELEILLFTAGIAEIAQAETVVRLLWIERSSE
jgi:hypothetical protein